MFNFVPKLIIFFLQSEYSGYYMVETKSQGLFINNSIDNKMYSYVFGASYQIYNYVTFGNRTSWYAAGWGGTSETLPSYQYNTKNKKFLYCAFC